MSFLSWYSLFREQTNARRSTFLFFPSTESTLRRIYPLLRRRTHKECDEDAKNNSFGRCNARELTWNDKDNKKSIVFHEYSSWILTLEWTAEGNGYGSWCRSFRFYQFCEELCPALLTWLTVCLRLWVSSDSWTWFLQTQSKQPRHFVDLTSRRKSLSQIKESNTSLWHVVEILVEGQPKWRKRHWFRDCFHICFLSHRSLKK